MSLVVAVHNTKDIVIAWGKQSRYTWAGRTVVPLTEVEKVTAINDQLALMVTGSYNSDKLALLAGFRLRGPSPPLGVWVAVRVNKSEWAGAEWQEGGYTGYQPMASRSTRANCGGRLVQAGHFGAIGEDGNRRFGGIRAQFFDIVDARQSASTIRDFGAMSGRDWRNNWRLLVGQVWEARRGGETYIDRHPPAFSGR